MKLTPLLCRAPYMIAWCIYVKESWLSIRISPQVIDIFNIDEDNDRQRWIQNYLIIGLFQRKKMHPHPIFVIKLSQYLILILAQLQMPLRDYETLCMRATGGMKWSWDAEFNESCCSTKPTIDASNTEFHATPSHTAVHCHRRFVIELATDRQTLLEPASRESAATLYLHRCC